MCEIPGLDPLYLADEGTLALFVPTDQADIAWQAMRATPKGQNACEFGNAEPDQAKKM